MHLHTISYMLCASINVGVREGAHMWREID